MKYTVKAVSPVFEEYIAGTFENIDLAKEFQDKAEDYGHNVVRLDLAAGKWVAIAVRAHLKEAIIGIYDDKDKADQVASQHENARIETAEEPAASGYFSGCIVM